MNRALLLGTIAALFFAFTFVINRAMTLDGGSVLWLSGLRYLFTAPMLGAALFVRREARPMLREIGMRPWPWVLWGTVGFGLFYLPLTWASHWAPAWLVAGSWQMTIVMGSLMVPLIEPIGKRAIPWRELWPSAVILGGVGLTEWISHGAAGSRVLIAIIPIAAAAVAYPLGNRQMMRYTQTHLPHFSVYQRTFGMTLGSMPFWIAVMAVGAMRSGWPSSGLVFSSLAIALLSGVIATVLFFAATDLAQGRTAWLARIEATQALEIVFTVLMASLLFGQRWPTPAQSLGLAVIMVGMVLHSLRRTEPHAADITLSG